MIFQFFFLLTFSQTLQRGNEKKELVERDLKRIYKEIDPINGYKYFKEKTYIFPVNLLDEYEFSIKNFGLKTVLKEVYTRFKNCIICGEDIEEIKQNLKKTEKKDKKIVFLKKQEILYTLNKNGNNLYKYIKEINDVMINAKIYSESTINNYSIASGILGLFGIFTSFLLKNFRKNILLTLADNFKKTDKEKENLINENSQIINGNTIFNNIPLISIRTNYNNIKEFGIHYLNLFSEELEREGIEGMGKLLLKLINCYNNSINSLLKLSEKFEL